MNVLLLHSVRSELTTIIVPLLLTVICILFASDRRGEIAFPVLCNDGEKKNIIFKPHLANFLARRLSSFFFLLAYIRWVVFIVATMTICSGFFFFHVPFKRAALVC